MQACQIVKAVDYRRIGWLLGFLLVMSVTLRAERLPIRTYTTDDGLAHSRVIAIHQDRKGYLWFGTWEGLSRFDGYRFTTYSTSGCFPRSSSPRGSRFDGYRFTTYSTQDGLGHPIINAIVEDRQGRLWVGTNGGGVARLVDDPRESSVPGSRSRATGASHQTADTHKGQRTRTRSKFISFPVGKSLDSNRVNAMLFDDDNILWVATDAELYRAVVSSPPAQGLTFEVVVPRRPYAHPMAAFADSHGRLWFGMVNELFQVVQGHIITYGPADEVGRHPIASIVEDRQGRLLVANHHGVFEFIEPTDPKGRGRWKKVPLTLRPDQGILSMALDSIGALWIGTTHGLIKYEDGQQTVFTTAHGLSDNTISALREDREGNLWIGTYFNGVCKLSGEMIVSFTRAEGLPDQNVLRVVEDHQGRIYASTERNGLVEIVAGKAVPIPGSEVPPFHNIQQRILQDHRKDWWIGTDRGLFRFPGPKLQFRHGKKFTAADGISETPILTIHEDPMGRLWIISQHTNLYQLDVGRTGRPVFERIPVELDAVWMFGDRSGALWLAPLAGLWRLRDRTIVAIEPSEGLPEPAARAFYQDRRGWLWIGSRYKGVSVTTDPTAEHPRFVNYSTQHGLASDTVWCITEDDVGRIYVGTGKGLDRLDPTTGRIRHFTTADGLAGDLINHCFKDRGGHIWVATTTGLSKFDPRAERPPNRPPPIYLSRIQVAGENLPLAETGAQQMTKLTLPTSRNNLLIEYVGVSFQSERVLRYQYRLEGVDTDWSLPTEQRSVSYARLAPGSYRFLVRAINRDGETSREPAVFEFRILPPIWQRWWFLVLAAMVAGSVVYALHRYRVARLIELERVRTRIASDLHDDIGSSLSQMAILSEVVKRHPTVTQPELAHMLTHIADMARGLVDGMSDIVWSIDPRRDDLRHLIERIGQFAFDVLGAKGIAWELQTQPPSVTMKLTPDQRRHIYLIFKEAITNIARHAHCTSVLLTLKVADHRLIAEIYDDGRGFDRARLTDEARPMRGGHGLENMQARAAELGGQLQIESAPDLGTRLILSIPLT